MCVYLLPSFRISSLVKSKDVLLCSKPSSQLQLPFVSAGASDMAVSCKLAYSLWYFLKPCAHSNLNPKQQRSGKRFELLPADPWFEYQWKQNSAFFPFFFWFISGAPVGPRPRSAQSSLSPARDSYFPSPFRLRSGAVSTSPVSVLFQKITASIPNLA
jgi:hypothetical protein